MGTLRLEDLPRKTGLEEESNHGTLCTGEEIYTTEGFESFITVTAILTFNTCNSDGQTSRGGSEL